MNSCSFFGHRESFRYNNCENKITNIIKDLIENHNVSQFYSGFRGKFETLCANIVCKSKNQYPHIINTLVLSYHPNKNFWLPSCFDNSVYLLEKKVPPKFAITYTNKRLVDISDFIVSGVDRNNGGAFAACQYAKRNNKIIINIYDQ